MQTQLQQEQQQQQPTLRMTEQGSSGQNGDRTLVRQHLIEAAYGGASNLAFNEQVKKWMNEGRKIYHFAFGQSPFPIMDVAVEALRQHAGENAYLDVQGIPELRQGICTFHQRYDGLNFDPSRVIVGPGSKELIFLLMNVFAGKKELPRCSFKGWNVAGLFDKGRSDPQYSSSARLPKPLERRLARDIISLLLQDVLILSPSWTTYRPQAILAGHDAVILNVGPQSEWKLTPYILEETFKSKALTGPSLLILTNPCNPTGTAYSEQELTALTAVFRKYNVIVLCDEIYARLSYDQNHVSLCKMYPEGSILSTGLSKWASAGGWRIGYHVYPKELSLLMRTVKSAASHTYSCAPAPVQRAAAKLFKEEAACDDYIRHTARVMSAVAEFSYRELQSVGVKILKPRAGYYIFPDFQVLRKPLSQRGIKTCEEMCSLMLEECSVAVMAGGPAFLRPVEELTTRLCYVNFDGAAALQKSRERGLDNPLPESFVQEFCTPVYEGILSLKSWVKGLVNETDSA